MSKFAQSSNMFWLFTEIYWRVDEVIFEQHWRVLYSTVILKSLPISIICPISFHLTAGKMANSIGHQSNILKIQNQ
jgi:hypothetical protein